jgi:transposase
MIPEELRSRIRRLFFAEHWKVGTIATEVGAHHETVTLAIEAASFTNVKYRALASPLDPYKEFLQQTLEKHPRLRATRLFDMIKPRGYTGSVVQLRRYVRKVRPISTKEAFFRLRTLPGELAQVVWACFGRIPIGRAKRALSCFVIVLSSSRAMFAFFFLDQRLESFLAGHVLAFEALGGVPRSILYDNLKSAVLARDGDLIRFLPALLELAGHYHFAPKPCAPYRGNEKGKVERTIQYLRHSFFAARHFATIDDLNAQLAAWIERTAHARLVPGDPDQRLVRDAFAEEQTRLLPLPEHPFPCDLVRAVASGKTPYIRFDLNDYSIPHTLVQKPLTLIASRTLIRLVDGEREVARHERCYDRAQQIEAASHLAALATQKRHATELRGRDRLRSACAGAAAFLEAVALRGGHLGGTTSRLLQLLDRYGAVLLDAALSNALARGAANAGSVAHWLDQNRRAEGAPPRLEAAPPLDPRARELHVTPHPLAPYDALARPRATSKDPKDDSHGR